MIKVSENAAGHLPPDFLMGNAYLSGASFLFFVLVTKPPCITNVLLGYAFLLGASFDCFAAVMGKLEFS